LIGTKVGSYEITAKLGQGGMGEVWRAVDSHLKRDVAIKVLPAAFVSDRLRLARFEREAQLLAQLNHPHVAQIYGLETSGERHALVMELVEGPTLDDRLARGALALEESLEIARQIAEALEAAHERGIVHRDLKPQNIKVRADGTVKVLDFGLAKAMESAPDAGPTTPLTLMNSPTLTAGETEHGVILGTAAYMAPEQARGGAVDKRVDIWAFGVVLFEMLSGSRPFGGESVSETLASVLRDEIDFAALPASTPPPIRRLVRRCLERIPRNRLHDIADARIVIQEVLAGSAEESIPTPAAPPARGRVAWAVAGAALLVAAGLGTLVWRQAGAAPRLLRYQQVTYQPQYISNARFAPDGRTVVFSAALEGNHSALFVRRPEDPQSRPLAESDVQLLVVSSQGELAVLTRARYLFHRTYLGTLARMPLAAAAPREVLEAVTAADWSPDGKELAVIRRVGDRSRLEFPIGKVLAESAGYLSDVHVSPLGDRVAFMPHALSGDNRGPLVVVDREGKEIARSPEYWGLEGMTWTSDGQRVIYSGSVTGGRYELHALHLDGRIDDVLADSASLIAHDRALDGRLLVSTEDRQVLLVARFSGEAVEREVASFRASYSRFISADGRTLLFDDESEMGGPNYAAFLQRADRSAPVRLGEGTPIALSPDDRTVLAYVTSQPPRLMLYPTGPGEPREISAEGFSAYTTGSFLPDGRGVLFCGTDASQSQRCFIRDLETRELRPVTPAGTDLGILLSDGRAVLAQRQDGHWVRYSLAGGAEAEMPQIDAAEEVIGFSSDGQSLFVYRPRQMPSAIERLDLATGARSQFRALAPPDAAGATRFWFAVVSADESAYAYTFERDLNVLFSIDGAR
jgi:tRNA A-37 threonylcarbamoyl transferase component Bud32/Tol biopolymer transport system component